MQGELKHLCLYSILALFMDLKPWSHKDTCLSEDEDEDNLDEDVDSGVKKGKYAKFWEQFSKVIKLGIIEDAMNHDRLAKLLRFHRFPLIVESYIDRCNGALMKLCLYE